MKKNKKNTAGKVSDFAGQLITGMKFLDCGSDSESCG